MKLTRLMEAFARALLKLGSEKLKWKFKKGHDMKKRKWLCPDCNNIIITDSIILECSYCGQESGGYTLIKENQI